MGVISLVLDKGARFWHGFRVLKKTNPARSSSNGVFGDFAGIQTRNLLIRSQMLYSVELRNLP